MVSITLHDAFIPIVEIQIIGHRCFGQSGERSVVYFPFHNQIIEFSLAVEVGIAI